MTTNRDPELETIEAVRRFNRFYTRQLGLLDEGLLDSPYPLTEVRVLYEIGQRDDHTAADLVRTLGIDAGYLSRILKKFERRGWMERRVSEQDARRMLLRITDAGSRALEPLDRASRQQVGTMLAPLSPHDRKRLLGAMQTVEALVGEGAGAKPPYTLRRHRIGDLSWVARRHGMLYAEEHGWDPTFEALVAKIGAEFIEHYDPERERAWIAEIGDEIVGSVFIVRESDHVAKLRMLYLEPHARGLGLGRRLVEEAIAFARAAGYSSVTLWTVDILHAARRIYQAAGFELASETPERAFGHDLVHQHWTLQL